MNDKESVKRPAVIVAEKLNGDTEDKVRTLSTGVRAILTPVSASLIDEVTAKVKDPKVPMWINEDKGREEPNPGNPDYIAALADAERERGKAAMDALVMFGVDLVDGVPEDDSWLKKLQFLKVVEDRDDLSHMEREFAYKKFVAVSAADIGKITELSGISAEDVEDAEATFQRQKVR
jgi:hypothetical protein